VVGPPRGLDAVTRYRKATVPSALLSFWGQHRSQWPCCKDTQQPCGERPTGEELSPPTTATEAQLARRVTEPPWTPLW
jgi:hypothetical protein